MNIIPIPIANGNNNKISTNITISIKNVTGIVAARNTISHIDGLLLGSASIFSLVQGNRNIS